MLLNGYINKKRPYERGVEDSDFFYLFNGGDQQLEGLRLVHGQIGEDLAVKTNALLSELVNERGIGQAFGANGGVDTGDPQRAVFPFLQFATDITVLQALLEDVFCNGIDILPLPVETFRLFQDAFPASPAGDCVN